MLVTVSVLYNPYAPPLITGDVVLTVESFFPIVTVPFFFYLAVVCVAVTDPFVIIISPSFVLLIA